MPSNSRSWKDAVRPPDEVFRTYAGKTRSCWCIDASSTCACSAWTPGKSAHVPAVAGGKCAINNSEDDAGSSDSD